MDCVCICIKWTDDGTVEDEEHEQGASRVERTGMAGGGGGRRGLAGEMTRQRSRAVAEAAVRVELQ